MVRAKFQVVEVAQNVSGGEARKIKLSPIYDQTIPEDRRFAQATPSGELTMYLTNPAAIEQLTLGKFFYLDFTPVED